MFSRLICSTADLQQVRKVFVIFLMSTLDSSYCTAPVNTFIDITKDLGLTSVKGTIGGFGDIDSDRDTDLIFISESKAELHIYTWEASKLKFERHTTVNGPKSSADKVITNVATSDYDGDGCMDLLVTFEDSNPIVQSPVDMYVYWNNKGTFPSNTDLQNVANFADQPLVLDVNGDLLPDLFGTDYGTKERIYVISRQNRTFHYRGQKNHPQNDVKSPQSSAFVDMDGDYHADLFIPTISNDTTGRLLFEIWHNREGRLKHDVDGNIEFNERNVKNIGQVSFGDFDMDGKMDFILPIIDNSSISAIYLYSLGKWFKMMSGEQNWRFPSEDFKKSGNGFFPPTFRIGDFNMDGYPDVVAVLEFTKRDKEPQRRAALLENVACSSSQENGCNSSRTFTIHRGITALNDAMKPKLIAFVDFYENGVLDLLVMQDDGSVKAYKNEFNTDTSFLKVSVLSGRCYKGCTCLNGKTPYGANQAGAVIKYVTTAPNGVQQTCIATQLTQSAHFALQLPYTVFGLGRTPNFVDQMFVGIPQAEEKPNRVHEWMSLIPNSQVIVIPYPPDKPADWMTKLLLTPSKLLLETGGVLIGTCLLVAGLILILHIKEKKEDEREKRQEAHKFHFDAL